MSVSSFVIASRGSKLALWQAHFTADLLPGEAEVRIYKTQGDQIQHLSLSKVEGKGFFTKEIEEALLSNEANVAVHSLKDLPTEEHPDLEIVAIPKRYPATDLLLVNPKSINTTMQLGLKSGAKVGTSSIRRKAQLLALRPDIQLVDIRGNVPTRAKRVSDDLDAVILARAGVERLELMDSPEYVVQELAFGEMLPAPAQGALGIQMRRGDPDAEKVKAALHCEDTARCVAIERGLLSHAGGGCHLPLGALAEYHDGIFKVNARVTSPDGKRVLEANASGGDAGKIVESLWTDLAAQGAEDYL